MFYGVSTLGWLAALGCRAGLADFWAENANSFTYFAIFEHATYKPPP